MRTKTKLSLAGLIAAVAMAAVPAGASATTGTFTSGPGTIPDNSTSLVPVTVSGLPGVITDVNVTVTEMSHIADGSDIDLLLRNPNGGSVILLSDAGGADQALTPSNFTFDDAAASLAPSTGALSGGTFKPTNYVGAAPEPDTFGGAPAGPYGSTLAALNGVNANAVWELYARDDTADSGGSFANYSVTVTTNSSGTPTVGPKPKKAKKKKKCKPKKKASQKPKKCKPKKGKPHQ